MCTTTCKYVMNPEFIINIFILEVIVIFQMYINIIYIIVFSMLGINTDARYEYK